MEVDNVEPDDDTTKQYDNYEYNWEEWAPQEQEELNYMGGKPGMKGKGKGKGYGKYGNNQFYNPKGKGKGDGTTYQNGYKGGDYGNKGDKGKGKGKKGSRDNAIGVGSGATARAHVPPRTSTWHG